MSGINWTSATPPHLVYLLRAKLEDKTGNERVVRWFGPTGRTSSGLSLADPDVGGKVQVWEPRLSGGSIDATLGRLSQSVQAVTDLDVTVRVSNYSPSATSTDSLADSGLLDWVLFGRWSNRSVKVWLYDKRSGDSQEFFVGKWDREPTSVIPGSFKMRATESIYPLSELISPNATLPAGLSEPDEWTDDSSDATVYEWWPNQYYLHRDHWGKSCGIFAALSSAETDYVWRELIPYGYRGTMAYAWVSPAFNHYVHEIYYEANDGTLVDVLNDIAGAVIVTGHQDRADRGPLGTIVRFSSQGSGVGSLVFNNYTVPPGRVWARVSGCDVGQQPNPSYNGQWYDAITAAARDGAWHVMEDIVERPELMNLPGHVWGTNAISDFQSNCPTANVYYKRGLCAIPRDVEVKDFTARDALGGIAQGLPADLCHRWDPAAGEKRLFPLWRPKQGDPAKWKIRRHDFASVDPPDVRLMDDPDGEYGTRFIVKGPAHWLEPVVSPTLQIDIEDQLIEHKTVAVEDGPGGNFAGTRQREIDVPVWMTAGPSEGFAEQARFLVNERGQRQRAVDATLGWRSFSIQMGDSVAYDMPGVWSDVGQVRKLRYDLDRARVTVRTYHVDFYSADPAGQHEGNDQ